MTKNLSWDDIEKIAAELAGKIKASGFQADYIIGVTTGGLIPLSLLVRALKIKKILTISANSYEKDKQKDLNVTYLPKVDLSNLKILLVDEIADSGITLNKISAILKEQYKVNEIKTVVLAVNKEKCQFWPDFWIVEENKWVVFPWEKGDFPEYF